MSFKRSLIVSALSILNIVAIGQIQINEICASNASVIEDADFNEYSDWIELYNSGSERVNLDGYYITDNFDSPDKFEIKTSVFIEAGGYLLIWADGNNTGIHTSFKLSADGEQVGVYNPSMEIIDTLTFGLQMANVSFGRTPDGSNYLGYFTEPSPGESNKGISYNGFANNAPEFSVRGGFYFSSVQVELVTNLGGEIRYTIDGTEPNETAILYTSPIQIDETTVLRAHVVKPNLIPGPIVTNTYFINENSTNAKLPVVSIATNPENFWDSEKGIYVQDFKPLWEVPINIELFENNGGDRAAFNELAGTKVNGLWSWQLPQKMLGVYFKKQYGSSNLQYPLFSQRSRNSYKSFALRASGSDWSYTLFRDILGQHATLYNMDIDIMSFKPAVVFLNGEYLGIHNMREKVDDDYIEKSYNMEAGTFDLIENEDYAEAGDLDEYASFSNLLNRDLSVQANFDAVADLMDIDNFTDYAITEMATANTSISHNVMAWKPKQGGKWRWVLMDLDRGFFNPSDHLIDFYLGQEELPLNDLFKNSDYRSYFGNRLASHLFTSFNPERMSMLIEEHKSIIEDEIPRHINRWLGTTSSYGNALPSVNYWQGKVEDLKTFANERPLMLLNDLSNYGFSGTVNLSLSTLPENAGQLYLNGFKVPQGNISGAYLKDVDFQLEVRSIPGYNFSGWTSLTSKVLVEKGAEWKYLDNGSDLGISWIELDFNDSDWSSGKAKLGYGEGDENTVVSYGGDGNNKYITTYFRKKINITAAQLAASNFTINLLRDDGALVYLNGLEVIRTNMSQGAVNYQTLASATVSGESEYAFTPYSIDASYFRVGENVLAVEIHQRSGTSSDISFDLELTGVYANDDIFSTENIIEVNLNSDNHFVAVFEESGSCIIPSLISTNYTLNKECSPYLAQGDVVVAEGAVLTIQAGVEILMPEDASILINGSMVAEGSSKATINFKLNPEYGNSSWGILSFKNTTDTSMLKNVTIKDASVGVDKVFEVAAISAFNSVLVLDSLTLLHNYGNPISARYSDITLTNSHLHSEITGDLINVKYGKAYIEKCRFEGNDMPDTDAIDYDEIDGGTIKSCLISNFWGSNSDAVDIGEQASNIIIDSLWVFAITDKGVSVGQQSSVSIKNSVFVNCNMGVGVKDSSHVMIDNCTFYGNGNAVACFEKNIGKAGGNGKVYNSILSNSYDASVYSDDKSKLQIQYSLSDNIELPVKDNNLNVNPIFENVTSYNFNVKEQSPAIASGMFNNTPVNIGTKHPEFNWQPTIIICKIFLNPNNLDYPEFIALYNPDSKPIDISNYTITKGITVTIPEGTIMNPNDTLYLTDNKESYWWNNQINNLIEWESGKLSNNGEAIQLENNYGMVVDYIRYENDGKWPSNAFEDNMLMFLIDANLDNHFAEYWSSDSVNRVFGEKNLTEIGNIRVYPNPAINVVNISCYAMANLEVKLYNVTGRVLELAQLDINGSCSIDLQAYPTGIYLLKVKNKVVKLMLLR